MRVEGIHERWSHQSCVFSPKKSFAGKFLSFLSLYLLRRKEKWISRRALVERVEQCLLFIEWCHNVLCSQFLNLGGMSHCCLRNLLPVSYHLFRFMDSSCSVRCLASSAKISLFLHYPPRTSLIPSSRAIRNQFLMRVGAVLSGTKHKCAFSREGPWHWQNMRNTCAKRIWIQEKMSKHDNLAGLCSVYW